MSISRRGFLGLVAGALAACKLVTPREHQLVEQVEPKAARPQQSWHADIRWTDEERELWSVPNAERMDPS
jgi:hypothetical protein